MGGSLITEAGTSCGRDKVTGTSGMLLSYRSDKCVEWQWEEVSEWVSLEEGNTEGATPDIKHRPQINMDINLETTMKAPVTVKILHDEYMRDQQDPLEYEYVTHPNNLINISVEKVNILSNAIKINHSLLMLAIGFAYSFL